MTRAWRGRLKGSYIGERVGGGGGGGGGGAGRGRRGSPARGRDCGEREQAVPAPGNARRPRGSREALLRGIASCRRPA